jgi:hypothetical protein
MLLESIFIALLGSPKFEGKNPNRRGGPRGRDDQIFGEPLAGSCLIAPLTIHSGQSGVWSKQTTFEEFAFAARAIESVTCDDLIGEEARAYALFLKESGTSGT